MKTSILITGIVVSIIGFTAFGYSLNKQYDEPKYCTPPVSCSVNADTSKISFVNIEAPQAEEIAMKKDLWYAVLGKNEQTYRQDEKYFSHTTQRKLRQASRLEEVILNYPKNWVSEYLSVEVWTTIDGKEVSAIGKNDVLTEEQKTIFKNVDLNTSLLNVRVDYNSENAVTGEKEEKNLQFTINLIPEVEAQYNGGYEQLISYLRGNSLDKILDRDHEQLPMTALTFTVDKMGKPSAVQVKKTSGDEFIDDLLIKLVESMPAWKPAKNYNGGVVEQNFELTVAASNGC